MPRFSLLKYFSTFLLSVSILACSPLFPQQGQGRLEQGPLPDCQKNFTKESSSFPNTIYKTWVKYDNLDYSKAFDAAVFGIQNNGYSITSTNRGSGTIHGQMVTGSGQKTLYSIDVKIVKENTSLIVNLSFEAIRGAKDEPRLCSFYEEFEKLAKQNLPAPLPQERAKSVVQPVQPPPIKGREPEKPVAPPVEAKQKPAPPPTPLRVTEVLWASANLREGPGMNYKVIGNAKKGTSLRILEENGSWLRVRLEDGREVWVSKSATPVAPKTSPFPSPPPSPPPTPKRSSSKPLSPM